MPKPLPDPETQPLLTVAEVAAVMPAGVGEKAVRAAIAAGQLPSVRVGRYVLVPTAALRTCLRLAEAPPVSVASEGVAPAGYAGPALAMPARGANPSGNGRSHRDRAAFGPVAPRQSESGPATGPLYATATRVLEDPDEQQCVPLAGIRRA